MDGGEVLEIGRDALYTMLQVSGPILLLGLLVGVVISLFQTVTQIQEMTLTFVPKILVVFTSLLILLPQMGSLMSGLMNRVMERMIQGG